MLSNGAYKAHIDTFTDYSMFNTSRPSKAEFFGPGKQGKFSFL